MQMSKNTYGSAKKVKEQPRKKITPQSKESLQRANTSARKVKEKPSKDDEERVTQTGQIVGVSNANIDQSDPPKGTESEHEDKMLTYGDSSNVLEREHQVGNTDEHETTKFQDIGYGIYILVPADNTSVELEADILTPNERQVVLSGNTDLNFDEFKLETDIFHIRNAWPKVPENIPKDKNGLIKFRVNLPAGAFNYHVLQFGAYVRHGKKWSLIKADLKNEAVEFSVKNMDALCIVSKMMREDFVVSPNGGKFESRVDNNIRLTIPPGAVAERQQITLHVQPINKQVLKEIYDNRTRAGDGLLAMSDLLSSNQKDNNKKEIQFTKNVQFEMPLNMLPNSDQSDPGYVYRLFRISENNDFVIGDEKVDVTNNTASCQTRTLSGGACFGLVGKNELQNPEQLSQTMENIHSMKFKCRLLYFINMPSSNQVWILITCVETSKVENNCRKYEQMEFKNISPWTSPDLLLPPKKKINISVRGSMKEAKYLSKKPYTFIFHPTLEYNFIKLQLEIEANINSTAYGIIKLSDEKNEIIDEIKYDPSFVRKYVRGKQPKPSNEMTTSRNEDSNKTTKSRIEDEFFNDKGINAVAKKLDSDSLFHISIHMDMTQTEFTQICERHHPPGAKQYFMILKTALERHKNDDKVNKLTSALKAANLNGLAEEIKEIFESGKALASLERQS